MYIKPAEQIINELSSSWIVFDECDTCGTAPQKPCYSLRRPTRLGLREIDLPHKKRKRLKDEAEEKKSN